MSKFYSKLNNIAWYRAFTVFMVITLIFGGQATPITNVSAQTSEVPLAASNTLSLSVISARTEPRFNGGTGVNQGDPIPNFKYIINIDNTGTTEQRSPAPGSGCAATDPGYPANCFWPSIMEVPAPSPIYTQGDQDDFPMDLPDGRYLISVLADGYKIDGAHFSVTNGAISDSPLNVELQPNPLPDSTLRAQVFADIAPTNMTQDVGEPGLAGFVGHITDVLGEVQTDVYGNPLCTVYEGEDPVTHEIPLGSLDADMLPVVAIPGGNCVSDANGLLTIPHLGSNRYALSATPPDGQTWIQTTTLEGNHDFDAWVMEGSTGYDTEFVIAGEPVPQPIFGFVPPTDNLAGGSGSIQGVVVGIKTYTPPKGGAFDFWGGNTGTKLDAPIVRPWLSLADLQAGDVAVWVGQGNADGSFNITGVPDGNYSLSWWDEPQDYNLNFINVTVSGGVVNMGNLPLNGWWTRYDGYVFSDENRNGVKDPGEPGVPNFTLTMRRQDNTLMDRGQTAATTDQDGYYLFESAYPLGAWTIMEAYSDSFFTTGVTYQADNQPTPTTVLGAGVDVSVLNIIGLSGRMDWGVHAYDPTGAGGVDPRNGGIVGTVSYGTTRNELDPQYLAAEDWQPGVSNIPVELYAPIACGTNSLQVAATLNTGLAVNNNGLTWTAVAQGAAGNSVTIEFVVTGTDTPLSVNVTGQNILINAATDAGGLAVSTADDIKAAIAADANASALVTVADTGTSDGSGVVIDEGPASLAGGQDTFMACDPTERYELAPDGSYTKGQLLNTYVTEHWTRPTGCVARDVDGNPLVHGVDENVLAPNQETDGECISSFMQAIQFGPYPTDQDTPDANFGAAVDGNYGFGDGCFNGTLDASDPANPVCSGGTFDPLPAGDYLVHIAVPNDALGKPLYKVTSEEDINIGNGDQIIPQVPPPACVGPLHTVDVLDGTLDSYPAVIGTGYDGNGVPVGVTVPPSTPVDNATFLDIGGSPFESMPKPRCDTKLVPLNNGKSIVPIFEVYTDVPIPSRLRGLVVDDINFSTDYRSVMYGEKAGIPFIPIGIYDFANRLVTTLESDFNGIYDVLLPSTNHISCPTPSGVCANMYRFVANDPGIPGRLNPNWNPRYRTIATEFEAFPGVQIPTDLAPTQVGLTIESPATGLPQAVACTLDAATPQLFAVSQPYVNTTGTFTINGLGFGATKGTGQVTLDGVALTTGTWSDTQITGVSVTASIPAGPHQLMVKANNGQTTINGLTFHVLGGAYNPNLYEVGPGKTYATIQSAIDVAAGSGGNDLVVVYPGQPNSTNPRGAYYENLIIYSPIKLQGVGSGGFQGATFVRGSIIDASAFGGDTDLATAWYNKIGTLTWDGNQAVNDGEAIYVVAHDGEFTSAFKAGIDGFDIRGGNQQGFPGNINDLTGGPTGLPPGIVTQGGAIFANAYARYLQITNNVVQNNGGGYGTIRIGTPDLAAPDTNQHNENVRIANNRIISNAGTNLAGGIGLFAGSDNYEIASNDICGNFSMEYGGGLSVYGLSPNGKVHHNRMYFNMSNDEGGAIMIAGQLPATVGELSPGSGPVDIYNNQIQANLANDDGGGLRFLMAGNFPMNVYNNMIVNNVSTHEGGGIGINDAPNVRVYNNTIMKNLTTATAVTSNGQPMPAGLSTSANSDQLQATLPGGSPLFSNPLLFNNIFWDNRAGTRAGTTVTGLGITGDLTPLDQWDLGVADGAGLLAPTNSIIQQNSGAHPYTTSPTNNSADPAVVSIWNLSVSFATWRQNPGFVDATLVTLEAPPNLLGNYHLNNCPGSPACNLGAASNAVPVYQQPPSSIAAPTTDIDDQARPALGGFDSGADEFGVVTPPPAALTLYFSTNGNTNPPGVGGTADDADIYLWNGTAFSRVIDANGGGSLGLPSGANVDGFVRVDDTHFYMSFTDTVNPPGPLGNVDDEDVVYYNAGTWSLFFDGSVNGVGSTDLDAISIVGGTLYFSTSNTTVPSGAGGSGDDADIYRWNGGSSYTRMIDASALGWSTDNVDGLNWVDATHVYLSYSSNTTVTGLGAVQDEDVVYNNAGTWSVYFDGTALGLTSGDLDLDAISIIAGIAPPPPPPPAASTLYFSTNGNTNPPGVGGTADDADIYLWNGTAFSRVIDANGGGSLGLPSGANVDGFVRVDDTHFYMSFTDTVNPPGPLGNVDDEDVVYYNAGTWSLFFDGSVNGVGSTDLDAISIVGGTLYFSTSNTTVPSGAGGSGDDADIYRWNGGSSYTRMIDASTLGWSTDNVDGLNWVDATHVYLSYSSNTTVTGLGAVQDEDVVYNNAGTWSVYFDGTALGLTSGDLDLDAISIIVTP